MEQLISKHPQHVDAIGGYYMTPAVAALAGRHFQLAQILHRAGSSVDPRGFEENSPLHPAAYYADIEMVRVLLDYGVDVNSRNEDGWTPLYYAPNSYSNDPGAARLLLDRGADPNLGAKDGQTPLHEALKYGWIEMARLLIEHGANVEVKGRRGKTALEIASEKQHDEIVKLLMEHGAN